MYKFVVDFCCMLSFCALGKLIEGFLYWGGGGGGVYTGCIKKK